MVVAQSLVQNAFQAAMDEFKRGPNNDNIYKQILAVKSIDEVYDLTDKLQADQGRKGHLRHLARIEPFLNRLRDYTGVIEVFMQVEPEIMALIWGPIKLLLQWSSVLTQSFDAVINTTADIGLLLPEFQEVAVMFSQNTRIHDVLVLFFKDILDFYQIGLKFFSMSRWKYLFEALWPRKKEHINLVKTHIERHTLLMRNEVRLEHIREEHDARLKALEHFKNAERAQRLQQDQALKTDINPRMYDDKLNWYRGRVCQGTGSWLMQDDAFKNWLGLVNGSSRIIWLQGIPGAELHVGKTFLAGAVVDAVCTVNYTCFAFLSHNFSSNTSALTVFHSLLFQLASQHEDLQEVLCHSTVERIKSDTAAAATLLKALLGCAGSVFIVIDGVDEIEEADRGQLLKHLLELSRECHETRILISSRRESDITVILESNSETMRVDGRNEKCIQTFVNNQLERMFATRRFPPEVKDQISRSLAPLAAKAKGMFLYVKVILSGIELVDDINEICEELSLLPEDSDAAYARVLFRINKLRPASEIEQALTIRPGSLEAERRIFMTPNLNRLCGPIIEVVDGYVQFVHFTVKEYLSSPTIDGHIDIINATLDLTGCCTTFLCQEQYSVDIPNNDDGFISLLPDGCYRLHYFASNSWFELVKNYLRMARNETISIDLADRLRSLMTTRGNGEFAAERDTFIQPTYLRPIKAEYPDIYDFLVHMAQFREKCSQMGYHIMEGKPWMNLDPLTIFHVSANIYKELDSKLCCSNFHRQQCHCDLIQRHIGKRTFKCGFLNCSFQQHGFESKAQQTQHEKEHELSWKCNVPGCEYENAGFLSQNMRDQHLAKAHRDTNATVPQIPEDLIGEDDVFAFGIDLIKEDNIEMVERLLPRLQKVDFIHLDRIAETIGEFGSTQMAKLLISSLSLSLTLIYSAAIMASNIEVINYLIESNKVYQSPWENARIMADLIRSDSQKMYRLGEQIAKVMQDVSQMVSGDRMIEGMLFSDSVITATSMVSGRENFLLSLWESLGVGKRAKKHACSTALGTVARTTCSVPLGEALLRYGADVQGLPDRRGGVSPLQYAARKSSAESAKFMKFLLFNGADPERISCGRKPSDEKGAQGISRWLGVSWSELITQARNHKSGLNP